MANCRNCLHSCVCFDSEVTTRYYGKELAADNVEQLCPNYKDRSQFVELPCKVGDTVWYIRDCGDWVDLCQQPCKICSTDCSMYRTEYRADWQAVEYEVENLKEAFVVLANYKKDFFATHEEAETAIAERREGERKSG